jgi:hypothetical protein
MAHYRTSDVISISLAIFFLWCTQVHYTPYLNPDIYQQILFEDPLVAQALTFPSLGIYPDPDILHNILGLLNALLCVLLSRGQTRRLGLMATIASVSTGFYVNIYSGLEWKPQVIMFGLAGFALRNSRN